MKPASRSPRVASLLPSATEIVCALGLERALVGISHECDHPPSVAGMPVLTSTKVAPSAHSRDIDRDVRRIVRDALAVYDIDLAALERAAPDVIVTQDLCDVCAVSFDAVCAATKAVAPSAQIVSLHPTRLADIWSDIQRVGAALDREAHARDVVLRLRDRVDAVRERARHTRARPRTLTIEWIDPLMIGGTWMPELVEIAHGEPLVARAGDPAPTLDAEALRALDPAPDVVLVKPCGFTLERTRAELATLRDLFGSLEWPALRERRVWLADGNAFFNRPGPRIVESLEILAACLHPEELADLAHAQRASFTRLDER
jgi:iron complex transport system substrate-binding protein